MLSASSSNPAGATKPSFLITPEAVELHIIRCTRCRIRAGRDRRCRRRSPRHAGEIEQVHQVRLGGVARREMRAAVDELSLHEPDDRRVVHGHVRNIVFPREGRDHKIGKPEPELRRKSLLRGRIVRVRSRIVRLQVAMQCGNASRGQAGLISIGIHRDRCDVGKRSGTGVGVVIRVPLVPAARDRTGRRLRRSSGRIPSCSMTNSASGR